MIKYIIIFLCSIISPIFSLKEIKPKLCINCKYFIEDVEVGKFSKGNKCLLFPKDDGNNIYSLVHGIEEYNGYFYCATARSRESMCGNEGKKYKKKYTKKKIS